MKWDRFLTPINAALYAFNIPIGLYKSINDMVIEYEFLWEEYENSSNLEKPESIQKPTTNMEQVRNAASFYYALSDEIKLIYNDCMCDSAITPQFNYFEDNSLSIDGTKISKVDIAAWLCSVQDFELAEKFDKDAEIKAKTLGKFTGNISMNSPNTSALLERNKKLELEISTMKSEISTLREEIKNFKSLLVNSDDNISIEAPLLKVAIDIYNSEYKNVSNQKQQPTKAAINQILIEKGIGLKSKREAIHLVTRKFHYNDG